MAHARHQQLEEAAYAAVQRWADAFNTGDVDRIVACYAFDAVVFGTLSAVPATTPDELRAYFEGSSAAKLRVRMGERSAAILSDEVVAFAGLYDFTKPGQGGTVTIPSRFTFVVIRKDGEWQIAHHHSSACPSPA